MLTTVAGNGKTIDARNVAAPIAFEPSPHLHPATELEVSE
jgi:hypothetical protein